MVVEVTAFSDRQRSINQHLVLDMSPNPGHWFYSLQTCFTALFCITFCLNFLQHWYYKYTKEQIIMGKIIFMSVCVHCSSLLAYLFLTFFSTFFFFITQALYVNPTDCYSLHWPISHGQLNVHSGPGGSLTSVLADLETIFSYAIQKLLEVSLKDLKVCSEWMQLKNTRSL